MVTAEKKQRKVEVLLVEDNAGDARLLEEIFKEGQVPCQLRKVKDGVEAMDYLKRRGRFAQAAHPDLILLDLNLPRKNGREVLVEVKNDPLLQDIPVLVLTTSHSDQDIREAYESKANFYIVKPMDLDHFVVISKYIEQFWIDKLRFSND